MSIWNQLPLLKILIPLIIGILLAISGLHFSIPILFFILYLMLLFFITYRYKKIIKNYQNRWIFGLLVAGFVLTASYKLTVEKRSIPANDIVYTFTGSDTLIVNIIEPISERENTVRIVVENSAIKAGKTWKNISGKTMLYLEKDSLAQTIKYGDKLLIAGLIDSTKVPANPGEFNYKKYLSYKGIFTQGYIKKSNWRVIDRDQGSAIKAISLKIRSYFLNIFQTNGIAGNEYGVVAALILGYTDKLDPDLMKSYANTGVMHVLSVSGMHVGIVFIGLSFLLSFLNKRKWGKIIKTVILIFVIWFYAAITGFSPAVNRAAAMITFVIIGQSFGRFTNIYNTLAASALFLLLINPLYIADLGFQLSYISVIGIVMLQKPISRLWFPKKWFVKQIWLLVSVSLAAQIATVPLSIYYFHQFPNYFLASNLVIVPFANIVIYNGILVLLLSPITVVAAFLSKVLSLLLLSLNSIITFIESLPYSSAQGLVLTPFEMLFLYLFLVFMVLFFSFNRKYYLRAALVMVIHFLVVINYNYIKSFSTKEFCIYSVKKSSAIGFIQGKKHLLLSDSALITNTKAQAFFLDNGLLKKGINKTEKVTFSQAEEKVLTCENIFLYNNFIQFYNKRIGIINKSNYKYIYTGNIKLDYLILSENTKADIGVLLQNYKPQMLIIDSSNSKYKSKKWQEECRKENIPCYAVPLSGAFVSEI